MRFLAAVAVALAHVYVLAILLAQRMPVVWMPLTEGDVLLALEARDEVPPRPPPISPDVPELKPAVAVMLQLPEIDASAFLDAAAPDWIQAGELAAASMGSTDEGAVREFGSVPKPAPKPREVKPFGWDKSHTQRVEALPGGISVRLGSRCTVIFAPLPVGGCSLGKIPARGDLFDEMSAPIVPGGWRDSAELPKQR